MKLYEVKGKIGRIKVDAVLVDTAEDNKVFFASLKWNNNRKIGEDHYDKIGIDVIVNKELYEKILFHKPCEKWIKRIIKHKYGLDISKTVL